MRACEVVGSEFHKYYADAVEIEFEKAQRLFTIAQQGRFVAPEPLRCGADSGLIAFNHLGAITSVRNLYLDYAQARSVDEGIERVFVECGRVLASIHMNLVLSSRTCWEAPPSFRFENQAWMTASQKQQAFLHCDFGFANVFVRNEQGDAFHLVVIDSSPNFFVTYFPDSYGPVYVDLANMCACLDGLVTAYEHLRLRPDRIRVLKRRFVEGYEIESGLRIDAGLLDQYTHATTLAYLRSRLRTQWLAQLATRILSRKSKDLSA